MAPRILQPDQAAHHHTHRGRRGGLEWVARATLGVAIIAFIAGGLGLWRVSVQPLEWVMPPTMLEHLSQHADDLQHQVDVTEARLDRHLAEDH
jgi:hypothetical protein